MADIDNKDVLKTVGKMFSGLSDKILKDVIKEQQDILDAVNRSRDNQIHILENQNRLEQDIGNALSDLTTGIHASFTSTFNQLGLSIDKYNENLINAFSEKYDNVTDTISRTTQILGDKWDETKERLAQAKEYLAQKMSDIGDNIQESFADFKNYVGGMINSFGGMLKGLGNRISGAFSSLGDRLSTFKDFIFSSFAQLGSFLRLSFETITNPIEGLKKAMGGMMSLLFGGSLLKKMLMGALVGGAAALGLKALYEKNPAFAEFVDGMMDKVKTAFRAVKKWFMTAMFGAPDPDTGKRTGGGWWDKYIYPAFEGAWGWFMNKMFGKTVKDGNGVEVREGGGWWDSILSGFRGAWNWFSKWLLGEDGKGEKGAWAETIKPALQGMWKKISPVLNKIAWGEDGNSGLLGNAKNWFMGKPNQWSDDNKPFWERVWEWIGGIKGLTVLAGGALGTAALANPMGAVSAVSGAVNMGGTALKAGKAVLGSRVGRGAVGVGMALGTEGMGNIAEGFRTGGVVGAMGGIFKTVKEAGSKVTTSGLAGAAMAGSSFGPVGALAGAVGYLAFKAGYGLGELIKKSLDSEDLIKEMKAQSDSVLQSQQHMANITSQINKQGSQEMKDMFSELIETETIERTVSKKVSQMTSAEKESFTGQLDSDIENAKSDVEKLKGSKNRKAREKAIQKLKKLERKKEAFESGEEVEFQQKQTISKGVTLATSQGAMEKQNAKIIESLKNLSVEERQISAQNLKSLVFSTLDNQKALLKQYERQKLSIDASGTTIDAEGNEIQLSNKDRGPAIKALNEKIKVVQNTIEQYTKQMLFFDNLQSTVYKPNFGDIDFGMTTETMSKLDAWRDSIRELAEKNIGPIIEFTGSHVLGNTYIKHYEEFLKSFSADISYTLLGNPVYRARAVSEYNRLLNIAKGVVSSADKDDSSYGFQFDDSIDDINASLDSALTTTSDIVKETPATSPSQTSTPEQKRNTKLPDVSSQTSTPEQKRNTKLPDVSSSSATKVAESEPDSDALIAEAGELADGAMKDSQENKIKFSENVIKILNAYRDWKLQAYDPSVSQEAQRLYLESGGTMQEDIYGVQEHSDWEKYRGFIKQVQRDRGIDPHFYDTALYNVLLQWGVPKKRLESKSMFDQSKTAFNDVLKEYNSQYGTEYPAFKRGAVLGRFRGGLKAILHEGEAVVSDLESERGDAWVSSFADKTMDKISSMKPDETTTLSKAIGVSPDDPMLTTIKNLFAEQRAFIKECLYNNSGPSAELLEVNNQIAQALTEMNEKSTGDSMVLDSLINGLAEERRDASVAPPMEFRQGDIRA